MELVVIISCLLLCAFFSGMEIAFVSSNKIYLEIEKKQENFIAKIIAKLTQKPSKFLATKGQASQPVSAVAVPNIVANR